MEDADENPIPRKRWADIDPREQDLLEEQLKTCTAEAFENVGSMNGGFGKLYVGGRDISIDAVEAFFYDRITVFPDASALLIDFAAYGDRVALAVAENACKFPALTMLDLSSNRIGPGGAKAIAESAHNFPKLVNLRLSLSRIGPDGVKAIAQNAHKFPALAVLSIRSSDVGDHGVRALAENKQNLRSLQFLDLHDNQITSIEAVLELIAALRKGGPSGGSLEQIDIGYNSLQTASGKMIEVSGLSDGPMPVDEVLAILTASLDKAASFVFDVRIVLVGVGENGKSQLAGALSGKLAPGEEATKHTRGFEFREYMPEALKRAGVAVRLLDMGGQPEQFSLHYLLWERRRNAFLLVCDSLKKPGWDGNRIRYFLRAITHKLDPSGKEPTEDSVAPVVAVLTMGDQIQRGSKARTAAEDIEAEAALVGVGIHVIDTPIDALGQTGIDTVHKAIDTAIRRISATATAPSFAAIRKRVAEEFGTCDAPKTDVHEIPIERYRQFAADAEETSDAVATNCLGILHALGDVIWIRNHDTLKHRVINVHWAGKAMYQLLTIPVARRAGGIVTGRDWSELIPDDPNELVKKLMIALKLMKQTHRTNPDTGDEETCYLVPDLMDYAPSKHAWAEQTHTAQKEYKTFLWESVFLQFVGDHADEIDPENRWAYRNEVKLKRHDGAKALVRADYESEPMTIRFYKDPTDRNGKSEAYCRSLREKLRTKDDPMSEQTSKAKPPTNPPPPPRDDDPKAVALDHLLAGVWMYRQQQDVRMWLTIVPVAMAIVSAVLLLAIPDNKVPGAVVAGVGVAVTFLSPLIGHIQKEKRTRAAKRFADFEDIVLRGKVEQCPAEYRPLAAKAKTLEGHPTVEDWFVNLDQVSDPRLRPLAAALQETRFRTQEYWFAACTGAAVFAGCVVVSLMVAWLVKDEKFDQWKLFLALLPLASAGFVAAIHNVVAYVEFHKVQRKCFAVYAPYKKGKITSEELAEEAEEAYLKMQTARESYPPVAAWIYWRNRPICNDSAGDYPRKINRKERLGDRGED